MTSRFVLALAALVLVAVATTAALRGVDASVLRTDEAGQSQPDARVELGRLLFWDPILSGDRDVACATCHHPDLFYADGREISLGVGAVGLGPDRVDQSGGEIPVMRRNSQTILNTAFNGADDGRRGRRRRRGGSRFDGSVASVNQVAAPMFWDNRVRSLEVQALEPIKALEEMRGTAYGEDEAVATVVARLRQVPDYVDSFETAFGPGAGITPDTVGQAIAAFERSLVAMNSPFDRFQAGDLTALTPQQQRGLEAFEDARCDRCHDGPMFSDFDLHAEGVAEHATVSAPDEGDGRFRFRTPSLRNVSVTAPYMHNGTLATLEDVLRFYDEGRSRNPNVTGGRGRRGGGPRLDRDFTGVRNMSDQEMADIIAFLGALTDADFDLRIPDRVPSGLTPGGRIGG
jgi:cytochrome c peroxidase